MTSSLGPISFFAFFWPIQCAYFDAVSLFYRVCYGSVCGADWLSHSLKFYSQLAICKRRRWRCCRYILITMFVGNSRSPSYHLLLSFYLFFYLMRLFTVPAIHFDLLEFVSLQSFSDIRRWAPPIGWGCSCCGRTEGGIRYNSCCQILKWFLEFSLSC